MGLGVFVLIECVLSFGLRWQAISGYVLGLAMVGLGLTRVRAGWPPSNAS
ncbi:MAG: hypothetical protein ABSE64_03390 [Vulcanimicrobiaceae bacterium]|jgi:hypothetical protein